jgi:uncharacterized protein YciW
MTSHARRLILSPNTHRHENIRSHNNVGLVYESNYVDLLLFFSNDFDVYI